MEWMLWYSDGSTFSSRDGTWDEAPAEDVQILVLYKDDNTRELASGDDEYRLTPESSTKFGKWMKTEKFYVLYGRAMERGL